MRLYNFHRSSASYRVRIALALKHIDPDIVTINIRRGDQRSERYLSKAPGGLVPLVEDDAVTLGQSLAIIQYLDDQYPEPRLIPENPLEKALAWQLALTIACDLHPLNNLRTLRFLETELGATEAQRRRWYQHWVDAGLSTFERLLANTQQDGAYCMGQFPTIADVCLIPQLANARRFDAPVDRYYRLLEIETHCWALPAFKAAARPMPDDPAAQELT